MCSSDLDTDFVAATSVLSPLPGNPEEMEVPASDLSQREDTDGMEQETAEQPADDSGSSFVIPVYNSSDNRITATFEPESVSLELNRKCSGCHNWVKSLNELRAKATAALRRIKKGNNEPGLMPPPPNDWKNTPEGAEVIGFLEELN